MSCGVSSVRHALRRVVCGLALCMFVGGAWSAGIETGDPVIDQAQDSLVRLAGGREATTDSRLNEVFAALFARPAFEGIRDEGWRYMLFTLVKTRLLVEQYAPRYANPKQRAGMLQVAQSLQGLEQELARLYGPKFALDEHLRRFPNNRDAFTQNLPTPPEAPAGKFFNAFDAKLRDVRGQLKGLGLVDF